MDSVAYMVIPIAAILVFWAYLFFRIYKSLKTVPLKNGIKIAVPIVVGGAITLPIAGLWTAIDAYSVAVIYFCAFLLLTDLVTLIVRIICKRDNKAWKIIRHFMIIPLLCTAIIFTYGIVNVRNIVKTEYEVTTIKNIRREGYKIALLSDIHYGKLNNKTDLQKLADDLSEQSPDLVILCGDIVDEDTTKTQMKEVFSVLGSIKSTFGTYFVFGNHDEQPYSKNSAFTEAELIYEIEGNGMAVLSDKVENIGDDLLLIGRLDRNSERKSMDDLINGADNSKYIICADHEPYDFQEKANAGIDLQLSGHTHGGQLFPVGTFMNWFNIGDMVYGKERYGNMTAITTSGITGSHPIRTQGKSEYVMVSILQIS